MPSFEVCEKRGVEALVHHLLIIERGMMPRPQVKGLEKEESSEKGEATSRITRVPSIINESCEYKDRAFVFVSVSSSIYISDPMRVHLMDRTAFTALLRFSTEI